MYFRSQCYHKRMKQRAKILQKIISKEKWQVRNSVGNQHKFAQQLPKEAKRTCSSSEEDKLARSEHIEDTKIQNAVDKLSFCCPSSLDDGYGCLLKLFRDTSPGSENTTSYSNYDYFECYKRAVTYVKQCRQLGKQDNSQLSEKENRVRSSFAYHLSIIDWEMQIGMSFVSKRCYQFTVLQNMTGVFARQLWKPPILGEYHLYVTNHGLMTFYMTTHSPKQKTFSLMS